MIPWAAKEVGRPVKWIEDRYEHLASAVHAKELVMDLELAVAADGTSSDPWPAPGQRRRVRVLPADRHRRRDVRGDAGTSLYTIDHVAYELSAAYTNKCMTGTYRGVGWASSHHLLTASCQR